jgi:hypothetical protein
MKMNQKTTTPSDSSRDLSEVNNTYSLLAYTVTLGVNKFGSYTFGIISVMVLYFGLFKPQIDSLIERDKSRDGVLEAMVDKTLAAAQSAERAAADATTASENNRATVAIMERVLSNVTRSTNGND